MFSIPRCFALRALPVSGYLHNLFAFFGASNSGAIPSGARAVRFFGSGLSAVPVLPALLVYGHEIQTDCAPPFAT